MKKLLLVALCLTLTGCSMWTDALVDLQAILADAAVHVELGGRTKAEFFWIVRAGFAAGIGALGGGN